MSRLRLTIDLLPRGAWGNNLSKRLPKKEWDTLRQACYERASHRCSVCGQRDADLDAHEVWDFDIASKTQTLKDIVALCTACHGVKHLRNSVRMGDGEQAKAHFLTINRCSESDFVAHCLAARMRFNKFNEIERWKVNANLDHLGGKGIEVKQRQIPRIINPYDGVDWETVKHIKKPDLPPNVDKSVVSLQPFEALYFSSRNKTNLNNIIDPESFPPRLYSIEADNYDGAIQVAADRVNRIEWIMDGNIVKTKYNICGRFLTTFSVENLTGASVSFVLYGSGGETSSCPFDLVRTQ